MHLMDEALEKILKNDPLLNKADKEEDQERVRHMTANAFHKLAYSACDLYADGELSWDDAVSQLIDSLTKLKGKESELKKVAEKDLKEDKKMMIPSQY